MIDALFDRDYPIISGINLFFAVAVMVINLLVDVLYAYTWTRASSTGKSARLLRDMKGR